MTLAGGRWWWAACGPASLHRPLDPAVVVQALNDYNAAVELQGWLDDETKHVESRFELRERALDGLRAAGIESPFETIQPAPVRLKSRT